MRTRVLTEAEVIDAAVREESHFYDRKGKAISGKQVQKIAVAFANADGGEFVIGLADDRDEPDPAKRWQGATNLEELNAHLQVLFTVVPALDVHYEILRCDTRQGLLLRVTIEKTAEVHKTSDGTVYVRYGAQSLPVDDPQKITELAFAKGASSFEDQLLKSLPTEQVVEGKELQSFLADYSPQTEPLEFALVGILAAIALPAYQDFTIRSQLAEALSAGEAAEKFVGKYWQDNRSLPPPSNVVAFVNSAPHAGVARIDLNPKDGVLKLTLNTTMGPVAGKSLRLIPGADAQGQVTWRCTPGDIPEKYLPANCRSELLQERAARILDRIEQHRQ